VAVCGLMLSGLLALPGPMPAAASGPPGAPAEASSLAVSLSVEQPKIVEPFPARVTLHLHNAGASALWLYRHVRDPQDLQQARYQEAGAGNAESSTSGGSSLVIHLEPAEAGAEKPASPQASGRSLEQSGERSPAGAGLLRSRVLSSVGMPHPRLVRLAPGGDATEGAVIKLQPAQAVRAGREEPVWGRYRFSITYSAAYSNGDALSRNLGVDVWQGEVNSNPVDIDLEPAPASAAGSVAGRITREDGRPLVRMLVSLSDREDHLVGQATTDEEGKYLFNHLPWDLYWVTARRPQSDFETATYDHVDLEAGDPVANLNLVMLQPEVYEPKQMLHKPVLLKVTQSSGQPLEGVALEALWSSGSVAETVKGETAEDGTAPLELIPGRNYVTLKRRGCRDEERRVDVAAGDGIDGVSLQFDCNGS
jgi:Carboxypeptidase regulatory-like domain